MIYRYFTKNRTHRYVDVLQSLVDSYNTTPHRSLDNIAPKAVNKDNSADLFAYMYLQPQKQIRKKAIRFRYKKGDLVRVSYTNFTFKRSFDEQFSREIFKIDKRFRMQGIPMFKLIDFLNEPIKGNFYSNELLKVDKDEDALWFIEKQIRKRRRNGQIEWLCKFEGWPNKFNQWLPEKDISDTLSTERRT